MFNHFVFTRFNLGLYDSEFVDRKHAWMDHRVELFREHCLPSFAAQTKRNFVWVLALDPDTPRDIIRSIREMITESMGQRPVKLIFEPHVDWFVREEPWRLDWVITSRFDNDDVAHPYYIEAIQSVFIKHRFLIDIQHDIKDLRTGEVRPMARRRRPNSPFVSLIEPTNDGQVKTVFDGEHSYLPDKYKGRILKRIFATRLEHDNNLLNFTLRENA